MRRKHINLISLYLSSGCCEFTDRTPALSKILLPLYEETPTRRFNHIPPPSPPQAGWAWWGRRRERARFGEKAGAVGPKLSLSRASPAAGSFQGALPSMRREQHGLPMWQECRGNNQTNNRDKRSRATSSLPPSLPSVFLRPPPHSPPCPGCSGGPGPPASTAGSRD